MLGPVLLQVLVQLGRLMLLLMPISLAVMMEALCVCVHGAGGGRKGLGGPWGGQRGPWGGRGAHGAAPHMLLTIRVMKEINLKLLIQMSFSETETSPTHQLIFNISAEKYEIIINI